MNSDELIKEWFGNLIRGEIDEETGTICNERGWGNEENVALHEKYVAFLGEILEKHCM